jgi:hypothetical protein
MKTLNFEQMETINGGSLNVCAIATGVGGFGLLGLAFGLSTGGIGLAVIGACAATAVLCEVSAQLQ